MKRNALMKGAVMLVAGAMAVTACTSSSSTASAPRTSASTTTSLEHVPTSAPKRGPAACDRAHTAGQFSQSFTFQGKTRTYQLYVPAGYKGSRRVPLVFDFHGFGSDAVEQMLYGNFKPLADAHDFLIVAPDGQESPAGRHFNLTSEPGLQNDIAMVGSLLNHIEATLCVDTTRVYATGMSDGGAITSVLACNLHKRFAAFAAVAVIIYINGCGDNDPVAIAAFSGTADPVVPFNGGNVHCCGGAHLDAAPAAMAGWAAHDHCGTQFTDTRLGSEVRRRTWKGCPDSPVFYIIDGGGHTWPGSIPIARLGMTTQQINASNVIWSFFSAHRSPA